VLDLTQQAKTAASITDAWFNTPIKPRKPSDIDKLDKAIALSGELQRLSSELKHTLPGTFDATIEQNIDFLHDIVNNFGAIRMHYYIARNEDSCKTSEE